MHELLLFLFAAAQLCLALPQQSTNVSRSSPPPGGCLLPDAPRYGEYRAPLCKPGDTNTGCDNVPGTPVPSGWTLKYRCFKDYGVSSKSSKLSVCNNGVWNNPIKCVNCGIPNRYSEPLIADGQSPAERDHPWVAAVYRQIASLRWAYGCSGTLISPHIVLTVAHCVTNNKAEITPHSYIRVGLGKYFWDYYKQEDNSIIAEVRQIIVSQRYAGNASSYFHDIALLDLAVSVPLNNYIMPACVDWQRNAVFKQDNIFSEGYLSGWGTTPRGLESNGSQTAILKYISRQECMKKVRSFYQRFILVDKFCASEAFNEKGGLLDDGYHGGGMTVVEEGVHYVVGVLNTRLGNDQYFSLFTDLKEHLLWLETEKSKLELLPRSGE